MRLSQIHPDPKRFQRRSSAYSEQTVEGIVKEGIDRAKFDPIPVLIEGTIAGDGHSRFEAIRRLAVEGRLPREWREDIPVKVVTDDQARKLARTANLARADFTPIEEARVFAEMLAEGMTVEEIGTQAHRSATYVRKTMLLNDLCIDIRQAVGRNPDAGGIDKHIAQALAEGFKKHNIPPVVQRDLWVKVLCKAELTVGFVRSFVDKLGSTMKTSKGEDGFLFEIPENVDHVLGEMKDRAQNLRRCERGLAWLLQAQRESGVMLKQWPLLDQFLKLAGEQYLNEMKAQTAADGQVLGAICAGA